jgi:hypothetical protein
MNVPVSHFIITMKLVKEHGSDLASSHLLPVGVVIIEVVVVVVVI